jgi:transcriptional regulator with XRE-family HTH domain
MSRQEDRRRAARYVRTQRGELGLSQESLAEQAGVNVKTVRSLERGERWPNAASRAKIERSLQWADGDLTRVIEGGYPLTGPLSDEDPDKASGITDPDELDAYAREMIAELPQPQRGVMEEIYLSLRAEQQKNERLLKRLLMLPRRRQEPPEDDHDNGESAAQ